MYSGQDGFPSVAELTVQLNLLETRLAAITPPERFAAVAKRWLQQWWHNTSIAFAFITCAGLVPSALVGARDFFGVYVVCLVAIAVVNVGFVAFNRPARPLTREQQRLIDQISSVRYALKCEVNYQTHRAARVLSLKAGLKELGISNPDPLFSRQQKS